MFDFINAIRQIFGAQNTTNLTGAEAVVVDFHERQELPDHTTETNGRFAEVERVTVSGIFNERVVANIVIDLGEYGEYTITVDLENELPEFMDSLNLEVDDLRNLVDEGHNIPMVRDGGEWRIKWEELDEWSLFSPDDEAPASEDSE